MSTDLTIPYSRAAWESWQDIFYAVNAKMMDAPHFMWHCPNNPWVIDVNRSGQSVMMKFEDIAN